MTVKTREMTKWPENQPTTEWLLAYARKGGDMHTWKHEWRSTPLKMLCERLEKTEEWLAFMLPGQLIPSQPEVNQP